MYGLLRSGDAAIYRRMGELMLSSYFIYVCSIFSFEIQKYKYRYFNWMIDIWRRLLDVTHQLAFFFVSHVVVNIKNSRGNTLDMACNYI